MDIPVQVDAKCWAASWVLSSGYVYTHLHQEGGRYGWYTERPGREAIQVKIPKNIVE